MLKEVLCSICKHKWRSDVEADLRQPGVSQRKVAEKWNISRDALRRHVVAGHVPGIPATAKARDGGIQNISEGEDRVLPTPTPKGEIDVVVPEPPPLPPDVEPEVLRPRPGRRSASPAGRTDPKKAEDWIRVLADTIYLGKFKGRETVVAIAARTGASVETVQQWADEAAKVVARSWGSAELQWQASLAEWRALLQKAKDDNDNERASECQKQIDKIQHALVKHARVRERYRAERSDVAGLKSTTERRKYLAQLIRSGALGRASVGHQLQICWPDMSNLQFTELVAQAADEVECRRGPQQARRLSLIGRLERIYKRAIRAGDFRTALRCVETEGRIDGIGNDVDMLTALAASAAWRVAAQVLQHKYPEAFVTVHAALVAEEQRKRAALAPTIVESDQAAE